MISIISIQITWLLVIIKKITANIIKITNRNVSVNITISTRG